MFGFTRRRMKHGRLKVHLSDSAQGTRSPIKHPKRTNNSSGEGVATSINNSDEPNFQCSTDAPELNKCTSGNSDNWMVLSIAGDKPTPRFNHAAAITGNKMVVVGGESADGLLEDVQVLNFDSFSWTTASSKLYLSPTSLPLKIPACKGHSLISWGKKVLLIGGKTDPASDRVSVWAFDSETECWSLMEAKGDIPVARSGHTVVRASSALILFGGEDAKRRKLNDLHMFDLKSLTWLPLHCTGPVPSPRYNHVAALYDDKMLLIFGGASKSKKTLNDLYSLDFETMIWSRIKIRGFHPSPRAGCCGVLFGTKWYIAGGGSRKKRHSETLVFDVLKYEWSVAVASPPSSVTTNKGFSLVLVQHNEKEFLVAFGGSKKDLSNQVEVLIVETNESSMSRRLAPSEGPGSSLSENRSSTGLATQLSSGAFPGQLDAVAKQNLASAIEQHGSGRRSLSESLLVDPNPTSGNASLRKQLHNEEDNVIVKIKCSEDGSPSQVAEQRAKQHDSSTQTNMTGGTDNAEEMPTVFESESSNTHNKQGNGNLPPNSDDIVVLLETDGKSGGQSVPSSIYQLYGTKMAALLKKNGNLEGQLAAALASHETVEKNLSSVLKSRQEMEKKLANTVKEMELLKEKLAGIELAQEEANNLSNIVHSDNVRLEHNVAFLKAVLDDTQKELHSTRGVLAGERARALQLQVEVFHLKQRLQSMENRAPTPRKPFHV
ncbi:Acyl-CoA-binding domain-containing protein [Actinidia chinensis var. chinensis]|uniref:Acyl-CoA-binding domain-containing protein n=1 Tax=Actinidia chinensis var. chinensis TaxID=1590841 RepID=A0A2R6PKN9_ACTCC|nr:Acyl-CoA-binding domain-containing protein [Actinidia chinensis var. chinensis]